MKSGAPQSIEDYIQGCPLASQSVLRDIWRVIAETAPDAEQKISYQMPAFAQNGPLVYFALCKSHVGFYPTPSAIEEFAEQLLPYRCSKGAVQFPLDQPMPFDLIRAMTQFRIQQNLSKKSKKSK